MELKRGNQQNAVVDVRVGEQEHTDTGSKIK